MDAESSGSDKAMEALEGPHKKQRDKESQIKPTSSNENHISYVDAWQTTEFTDMVLKSPQLRHILANRTVPISFEGMIVPNPAKTRVAIAVLRWAYWVWLKRWSKGLLGGGPQPAVVNAARQCAHPAIRRVDENLNFLGSLLTYGMVNKPQRVDGHSRLPLPPLIPLRLVPRTHQPEVVPPRADQPEVVQPKVVKPKAVQPEVVQSKAVQLKAKSKAVQPSSLPPTDLQTPQRLGRQAALRMISSYLAHQVRASYRSGRGARAVFAELAARTGLREAQVAAFWCRIRAVSLRHVRSLLAGGDEASPRRRPRRAYWAVADTAMLYDTQETVVTEDSLTLYTQSQSLWALLELVERWLLEPGSAAAWRAAKAQYARRGGMVSLVMLQRRWHELKASAAERVLALWRARRKERDRSKAGDTDDKDLEPPARLHAIQLAVVRRHPAAALRLRGWHARVRAGLVHLEDDEQEDVEPEPPPPPHPAPASRKESSDHMVITESPVETVDRPLANPQAQKGEDHSPDNDEIPPLVIDTELQTSAESESANSFSAFASLDLNNVESAIIFSDDDSDDGRLDVDTRTGEDSVSDSDKAVSVSEVNTTNSISETLTDSRIETVSVSDSKKGNFDSRTETKSVSVSNVNSSDKKSLTTGKFDTASVNQSAVPNETIVKKETKEETYNRIVDRIVFGDEIVEEGFDNVETVDLTDEVDDIVEEIDAKIKEIKENDEETQAEDTNAVEQYVENLQYKGDCANILDLMNLQSPVVPLKKLEIRQKEVKPNASNPDFNIKLKSLSPSFFKSRRNRLLLKKCVPLTVDLVRMDMREIEKRREEKELQEFEEFLRKEREMLRRFYDAEDDGEGDDMPTLEGLQEFLDVIEKEKLVTGSPLEASPPGEYCCLARFHLAANAARRRGRPAAGGAPYRDLPIHTDERCTDCQCCCAHLLSKGEPAEVLCRARLELACDLAKALREAGANVEQPMLEVITSEEDEKSESDDSDYRPSIPKKRKHRIRTRNPETAKRKSRKKEVTPEVSEVEDDPYAEWERQKNLNKQYFIVPQTLPNSKRSAASMEACKDMDRFKKKTEVKAIIKRKSEEMEESVRKIAQDMEVPVKIRALETDVPTKIRAQNMMKTVKNTAQDMEVPVKIRALDVEESTKIRAQKMEVPVKNTAQEMVVPVNVRALDEDLSTEIRAQDMEVPVKNTAQEMVVPVNVRALDEDVSTKIRAQDMEVPVKIGAHVMQVQVKNGAQEEQIPVKIRALEMEEPARRRSQDMKIPVEIRAYEMEVPDKRTVQESEKHCKIKIVEVETVEDKPASPVPSKVIAQEVEVSVKNRVQEAEVPVKSTVQQTENPCEIKMVKVETVEDKPASPVPSKVIAQEVEVLVNNRVQEAEVPVKNRVQEAEVPCESTVQETENPCEIKIVKVETVKDKPALPVPSKVIAQEVEVLVNNKVQEAEVPVKNRVQEAEVPRESTVQETEKPCEIKIVKVETMEDKPASPVLSKVIAQEVEISVNNRVQEAEVPGESTVQETEKPCEIKIIKVESVEDKPASPVPANKIRAQELEAPVKSTTQEKRVSVICRAQNTEVSVKNITQETEVPARNITQDMAVSVICRSQKTEVPARNRTQETEVPASNRTQEPQVPVKRTDEGTAHIILPCEIKIKKVKDDSALPEVRPPVRLIRKLTSNVSNQDSCNQFVSNQDVFKPDASNQGASNQRVTHPPVSSQAYQLPLLNISVQVNPMERNLATVVPTYAPPLISVALLNQQNGGQVYQPGQVFQQPGQMLNQAGQIYQQNQLFQTQSQILNQQQPIFQNQQSKFQQPGPLLNQQAAPMFQQHLIFQQGQILDQQTAQVYQQNQMCQPPVQFLNQSTGQIFQQNQLLPRASGQLLNQQSTGQVLDQPCSSGQFFQLPRQQYHQNQGYPPGVPGPGYQMGIAPQIPASSHQMLNFLSNQTIDVTQMLNSAETPASTDQNVIKQVETLAPPGSPLARPPSLALVKTPAGTYQLRKVRPQGTGAGQGAKARGKDPPTLLDRPCPWAPQRPRAKTLPASEHMRRLREKKHPIVVAWNGRAALPLFEGYCLLTSASEWWEGVQALGADTVQYWSVCGRRLPPSLARESQTFKKGGRLFKLIGEPGNGVMAQVLTALWWEAITPYLLQKVQVYLLGPTLIPRVLQNRSDGLYVHSDSMPALRALVHSVNSRFPNTLKGGVGKQHDVIVVRNSPGKASQTPPAQGSHRTPDDQRNVNSRFPNTLKGGVGKQPDVIVVPNSPGKASQTPPAQGSHRTPDDQRNVNSRLPNTTNVSVGNQAAVTVVSKSPGKPMQISPAQGSQKTPDDQNNVNSRLPNTINTRVGNQPVEIVPSKGLCKALPPAEGSQETPDDQKKYRVVWRQLTSPGSKASQKTPMVTVFESQKSERSVASSGAQDAKYKVLNVGPPINTYKAKHPGGPQGPAKACDPLRGPKACDPLRGPKACDPLRGPKEGSSSTPLKILNPGGSTATTKVQNEPIMRLDAKECRYAVVNFLERPREDIGELVCIPQSWIRVRRVTEEQSIVAYPNERPSETQRRVAAGEELSPQWALYLAVVRHETYTYDDARLYILEKKYGVAAEDLCTSVKNRHNTTLKRSRALESPVEKTMSKLRVIERTNGGSSPNDNVPDKYTTFVYPYLQRIPEYREDSSENDCASIVRKPCYPSLELIKSMKQHLLQFGNQNQVINTITGYDHHTEISKVAEGDQNNTQVLPTRKVSEELSAAEPPQLPHGSQDSEAQPMTVDEPEGNEDTVEVSSVRDDDSHRSGSPGVSTEETDRPVGYPAKSIRAQVIRLTRMFKNMDKEDLDSSERVLKIHKSYALTIESVIQKCRKSSRPKTSELNDDKDEDADDDCNEDEDEMASRKPRHLRSFVLPPEYDPKDSRWTLKYPENDPDLGLEELISGSKVYVNSIRLAHCLRVSQDCKTLARMLLAEIFSQSALAVCSLTGAKANAFHNNSTYLRPGLDKNSRDTMLTYVERHSRKEKWTTYDKQSVINSIRSKIKEIRNKHTKT